MLFDKIPCGFCFADVDNDGYGSTELIDTEDPDCDDPGESPIKGDCDDTNFRIFPEAPETCDGIDRNCDGVTEICSDTEVTDPDTLSAMKNDPYIEQGGGIIGPANKAELEVYGCINGVYFDADSFNPALERNFPQCGYPVEMTLNLVPVEEGGNFTSMITLSADTESVTISGLDGSTAEIAPIRGCTRTLDSFYDVLGFKTLGFLNNWNLPWCDELNEGEPVVGTSNTLEIDITSEGYRTLTLSTRLGSSSTGQ